jgi:hypothetical protein
MKIRISAKCSDLFWASLSDDKGKQIATYDGYVPAWMPGDHDGDYVSLDIDSDTGVILNWKKPSKATLLKAFNVKK